MKSLKTKIFVVLLAVLFSFAGGGIGNASIIIDPTTGLSSYFEWTGGLGPIDDIDFTGQTQWSVTTATNSTMTVTAFDDFFAGDEFALVFDGAHKSWTSTYVDASGYFHGIYTDLFLTPGTHTFTFDVTALAPGWDSGGAYAEFSPVSSAPEPPAIPEPATIVLLAAGLSGLAFSRRKESR